MRSWLDIRLKVTGQDKFEARCEAALMNIGKATKRGTTEACEEILEMSLQQVPYDTGALFASGFYEVSRQLGTSAKTYQYVGIVGYADEAHNPVNPKTGQAASTYVVDVHEDLTAMHPNGKAKFLEDPIREYSKRFPRAMVEHIAGDY